MKIKRKEEKRKERSHCEIRSVNVLREIMIFFNFKLRRIMMMINVYIDTFIDILIHERIIIHTERFPRF